MTEKQNDREDLKKVEIDQETLKQGLPQDENPNHGVTEVENSMNHRSKQSIVEGGANEQLGEPTPGYSTVAPGHQGGGKR